MPSRSTAGRSRSRSSPASSKRPDTSLSPSARPTPPATPTRIPRSCVPGSVVFHPTPGPVPLNDLAQWWAYVPGASWRHPWGPDSDNSGRDDHPVTHVAYEDAHAYAEWAGKQLPSEAEWEYAARGGLEGAIFAWGDDERPGGELMANYLAGRVPLAEHRCEGMARNLAGGPLPRQRLGLYDVTGNVWEWTLRLLLRPRPGAEAPESLLFAALEPSRRDPRRELRHGASGEGSSPPRHQGRLAPLRAELLPPLPAGRPPARGDRHLDQPHRLPLHHPRGQLGGTAAYSVRKPVSPVSSRCSSGTGPHLPRKKPRRRGLLSIGGAEIWTRDLTDPMARDCPSGTGPGARLSRCRMAWLPASMGG